jgi:hypothetical protein
MAEPKKRGGQPKADKDRKKNNFTFRLTNAEYLAVMAAADANERSMADEVRARLRASFDQPALIDALADRMRVHAIRTANAVWKAEQEIAVEAVDHLGRGMEAILGKDEYIT